MCLCSSQIHLVIIATLCDSHDPGATFDFLKDAAFSKGPAAFMGKKNDLRWNCSPSRSGGGGW